jgi:mono/diheme cytochrome c family protein
MRVLVSGLALAALFAGGCEQGSVGTEAISRCYPEPSACEGLALARGARAEVGDPGRGGALYQARCVSCHGAGGKGVDKAAHLDFSTALWQARFRDAELTVIITHGRPPSMPPAPLAEPEMADLIAFLRSLKRADGEVGATKPDGRGY